MRKICCFLFLFIGVLGYAQENNPLFIAHRGGVVPGIPENSSMAFQSCIDKGVAMIETDIRLTKDNEMVLFHDASLLRMTKVSGLLSDYTLAELQKLSLGKNQIIPSLKNILTLLQSADVKLLLDIKVKQLDYKVLFDILEEYNMKDRVYIGVRSITDLKLCKALDANVKVLGFIPGPEDLNDFVIHKVNAIRIWPKWLKKSPSLISKVTQNGIPVWTTAGTLKTKGIKNLAQQGATGFIHDTPVKAQAAFLK